jgi:DNA-binding LytR/AlgR family response regulator
MTSNEDDLTFKRASRTDPAAFLVKPFTDVQLRRTIELTMRKNEEIEAFSSLENEHVTENFLFIKKRQKIHKVAVDDIYYLEADGKYCRVCTKSDFYLVRQPLKDMLHRLPSSDFTHCHRSYVVNMNKVKFFDLEQDLLFLEERSVPVSKREKEKLLERLKWI